MEEKRKIELLTKYLDLDISHDISDFENVDCVIYCESTADGYEVWVCTNDSRHPSICEDVYYYDHDLPEAFEEQVKYGDTTFYIDADIYDDCYFEDKLQDMFMERVDEIYTDCNEMTQEEINYLKEEYGIEDEETETA
tara:strand:+ start:435 stop:848 length:414 start_codon:yes stop_codon:yes gene_type:complete